MKRVFANVTVLICLGMSVQVMGSDAPAMQAGSSVLSEALRAEQAGDYKHAADVYVTLAQRNDPDAQFLLARLYQRGLGFSQDNAKAFFWYSKAADQPSTPAGVAAESQIGAMYGSGSGVARSFENARTWYGRAAAAGDAMAQRNLGELYFQGLGGTRDYASAAHWFQQAASQHDAMAEALLGYSYKMGLGVPQDYQKALPLLHNAATQSVPLAQATLGEMYERGEGIGADFKQAVYWYEQAIARGGNLPAVAQVQVNLGLLYLQGRGVAKDCQRASSLFEDAADRGYPSAMTYVGTMYLFGQCKERDVGAARVWELRALQRGDVMAAYYLGVMTTNGAGFRKDPVLGYALVDTVTSSGHASASQVDDGNKMAANLSPEKLKQARGLSQSLRDGGAPALLKAMERVE